MVRKPYIPTGRPRGRPRKEQRNKKTDEKVRKEAIEIERMIEEDGNHNHIEILRTRKCCVGVVRVLHSNLCIALCQHCKDPQAFTLPSMELDLFLNLAYMKCESCSWVTIRRILLNVVEISGQ